MVSCLKLGIIYVQQFLIKHFPKAGLCDLHKEVFLYTIYFSACLWFHISPSCLDWAYHLGTLGGRAADLCTSWQGCFACPWGISCVRCPVWGCWVSRRCPPCPRRSPWFQRLRLTARHWSACSSWTTGWARAGWLHLVGPAGCGGKQFKIWYQNTDRRCCPMLQ